jgi:electron transport complex protein RnfG
MASKESTLKNMIFALAVISLVASLALGGIYNVTKEPITEARKAKAKMAIMEVIPEFDTIKTFKAMPADGTDSIVFNVGYKGDSIVGVAVATYSNKGYTSTPILLMVGFLPDSTIRNISVVQQKETPGLGTKMAEPKFKDQFNGINPEKFKIKVKKDGGDVDAITAATISSRAFCDAVNRAYSTLQTEGGKIK